MGFRLQAPTTFKASVKIPLPGGGESEPIEFEFKHRTRDEFQKFVDAMAEKKDADYVMEAVVGWNLTDEFNRINVDILLQNYFAAARVIGSTYTKELMALRLGN